MPYARALETFVSGGPTPAGPVPTGMVRVTVLLLVSITDTPPELGLVT